MRVRPHPLHSERARLTSLNPAAVLALALASLLTLATVLAGPAAHATPARGKSGPEPGKHIYDTTGLLTAAQVADLETHATPVVQAGAPTVVYLQAKDATYDQTYQDAGNLMNAWDVESAHDAHDGFVMFLNLIPGNLHHGQVVLFAGSKWFQNGPLTHDETQRIYQDLMLPHLRDGDIAGGIAAGLDAVASDLKNGPPAPARPSALQQALGGTGALMLTVLSILFALGFWLLNTRIHAGLPQPAPVLHPTERPPNDLAPAFVGALIVGHTHEAQMEATLLDFARRGLLAIEPVDLAKIRLRLLGDGSSLTGFEASLWQEVASVAGGDQTVLPAELPKVREGFAAPLLALKQELLDKGWYDAQIDEKRRPYLWVNVWATVGVAAALLMALIAQQWTPVLAGVIFLAVSVWSAAVRANISNTSADGQQVAAPWRDYRDGILFEPSDPAHDAKLSTELPYAVAMEIVGALDYRLQQASARGDAPAWFVRNLQPATTYARRGPYVGFYPYWMAWHSTLYPAPSSSGGSHGGFAGGGAAGGGGGGGGGF